MSGLNHSKIASVAKLRTDFFLFAAIILAALVGLPSFAGPEEDMLKSLDAIKKLEKSADSRADFMKLTSKYREIIARFQGKALDPTLAVLHYRLSQILLDEVGDSADGLRELSRVVELYPDSPEASLAMGTLYRFYDSVNPEKAGKPAGVGGPGHFIDPESGIGFAYDPSAWAPSKGPLPTATLIDLSARGPASRRRLSVICNDSTGMGIVAFASAFVDEMRRIPGVSSVAVLSSRNQFLGSLVTVISKLKVVSGDGTSILLQAVVRIGDRTLCIMMVDDFSKTVAASIDFNSLLETLSVY